jgi:rfaE bifunctional protein kinase chain/domain
MLTDDKLDQILAAIPRLRVGVLGDIFLDRYLDIDPTLSERSLETGLEAYQVVRIRPQAGAAGTVINNLAALGAATIAALSVVGEDGEGYELRRALAALPGVDLAGLFTDQTRRTPTYTKPVIREDGLPPCELNRLDMKNRQPLPPAAEERLLAALDAVWPRLDALLVLDQVDRRSEGIVTERVIRRLAELGTADPQRLILADSRTRVDHFRAVWLKPNQSECVEAVLPSSGSPQEGAQLLSRLTGRPVFCTCGAEGIYVVDARPGSEFEAAVPAYPVTGPIDIVGAGDSASAAIACAVAAGAALDTAADFGNLAASVTIQQLGTTGTASPQALRQRWSDAKSR